MNNEEYRLSVGKDSSIVAFYDLVHQVECGLFIYTLLFFVWGKNDVERELFDDVFMVWLSDDHFAALWVDGSYIVIFSLLFRSVQRTNSHHHLDAFIIRHPKPNLDFIDYMIQIPLFISI